ncbi:hypothetical protein BKA93DRAFT_821255 [Sparassis latifolia]
MLTPSLLTAEEAAWVMEHIRRERSESKSQSIGSVATKIATEFEKQFPPVPRKLHKNKKLIGMETLKDAKKRCEGRPQQVRKWILNHHMKLDTNINKNSKSVHLLTAPSDGSKIPRAKNARDLLWENNGDLYQKVKDDNPGVTHSELQSLRNQVMTDLIKNLDPAMLEDYQRRSDEDKAWTKALRETKGKGKDGDRDGSQIAEAAGENDRQQLLDNLQYTLQTEATNLAEKTDTSIMIMYGGLDATGNPRKWLISSNPEAADDIAKEIKKTDSLAYGIHSVFHNFILRCHPPVDNPELTRNTDSQQTLNKNPKPMIVEHSELMAINNSEPPPASDSELTCISKPTCVNNSEPMCMDDSEPGPIEDSEPTPVGDSQPMHVDNSEPRPMDDSEPTHADDSELMPVDDSQLTRIDNSEPRPVDDSEPTHVDDSELTHVDNSEPMPIDDIAVDDTSSPGPPVEHSSPILPMPRLSNPKPKKRSSVKKCAPGQKSAAEKKINNFVKEQVARNTTSGRQTPWRCQMVSTLAPENVAHSFRY